MAVAIIVLGISCEKDLFNNNADYTTGSSAAKDVAGSPENELSSLMHQQAQTLPAPVPPQSAQKSIITTSAVNPDLPFTVVALDEFYRPTDTLKANLNDVVYIELQGVTAGYYNGAILVQATGADIISIEESYDFWWSGIGLWWTPASADPARGGAGTLYYYNHFHSPDNDTYKSEGSSWSAAWQAEGVQYGYEPGPAGSLVTGTTISEARFYFSGYLGNHSKTRPGLRLGLKLKDSSQVGINISGHNRYEFSWLNLSPVYSGTITIAPRVNYQSIHNEGENAWVQVSCPENAFVGDTISVTAYGELMMDANEYSASVEVIDSEGVTTTLITSTAVGNEFGPVSFSVDITHASIWWIRAGMQSRGSHPGDFIFAAPPIDTSRLLDITPPMSWPPTTQPPLNNYDCTTSTSFTVTLTATDPPHPTQPKRPISGVDYINYEILKGIDRVSQGVVTPTTGNTVTIDLGAQGQGIYQIKFRAVDKAGNKEEPWLSKDIFIDWTGPTFIGNGAVSPGGHITGTTFATNGQPAITITRPVSDSASGVLDMSTEVSGEDAGDNSVSSTATATPVGGAVTTAVPLPPGVVDGNLTVSQQLRDKAGNVTRSIFTVVLDRVPPTITATRVPGPNYGVWYNRQSSFPVRVTFTAYDPEPSSGIKEPHPNPFVKPYSNEDKHEITKQAIDNAGNTSAPETVKVWIDKTAPDLPNGNNFFIYRSSQQASAEDIKIELEKVITDGNGSGIVSPITYGNLPAPGTSVQQVTITITATDNAGNVSQKTITVKVLTPRGK